MNNNSPTPPASITINIGGKPHEITMFFGRLDELAEVVGSFERLAEVDFHAPTRAAVLDICLVPRDERGRRIAGETAPLHQLSVEDGEAILDWAKDHLADFFIGRLEKHMASLRANGERLTGVGSSLTGLAASPSATA